MKSYQYFNHQQCEYYPCHKGLEDKQFNCMFCYCPLYRVDCPGNPNYIVGQNGTKIKDCSSCVFPHIPENYNVIMEYLARHEELVTVSCEMIQSNIKNRVVKSAGLQQMEEAARTLQEKAITNVYIHDFAGQQVDILLQEFDSSCIQKNTFQFGKSNIPCNFLEQIPKEHIQKGYLYVCHAPEVTLAQDLLSQYYQESWQIAILDEIRDWLHDYLQRKESLMQPRYVTDSFGPGYYGMPADSVEMLLKLLPAERVGVTLTPNGVMHPLKSLIGIYLILDSELIYDTKDCAYCKGNQGGCHLCKRNINL